MVWRALRSRPRLVGGVVAGGLAWLLLPSGTAPATRALLAWDIGVLIYLCLAAHLFATEPPERMPAAAEAQEEGEWTIFGLTLAVIVVSFVAVGTEFTRIKSEPPGVRALYLGLVAATLFLSWLMTHVTFAFRYAHEYYSNDLGGPDADGGLDFPGEKLPDYLDFLYFSLVLGMTFQVSDVQITSRKLRRVATVHGVLSFLFNTVIVALTVNLVAGLVV
ncbi:MAG TPA: DUF1345 domain-containing protein [Rhodopila sp.]|uniref:DUF1345 domain-containing protein n=1 Tax=Rhodopila sp. TaxID=2480087 RepID=UPI002BDC411F|nr:DUF1345 domain-containing protein [Rhodopila sp.]HVY17160.1 DUF1345 domain-containing protein [Rhodopila sp.]